MGLNLNIPQLFFLVYLLSHFEATPLGVYRIHSFKRQSVLTYFLARECLNLCLSLPTYRILLLGLVLFLHSANKNEIDNWYADNRVIVLPTR